MTGLLIKLLVCPTIVLASDVIFADVYFPTIYYAIIVGLTLAILAHGMEVILLKPGRFWVSNLIDFTAAFIVVYLSQFLLPGSSITIVGALLTSLLLSFTEYFQHLYLLLYGKTKKA